MLKITPAKAEAATAQTADAYADQAAMRPLAGFGAGAFVCAGAWAGLMASPLSSEMAALAGSRVKPSAFGAAYKAGVAGVVAADSAQRDNHNFIQTARLYPVTQGGVGPHPAREPEPV